MSLRGSLETFELSDVLALVASTTKTGELEVTTDRGLGRLAFAGGKVVSAEMDEVTIPVDVLARLLRAESGDFTFNVHPVDDDGGASDVPGLLAQAESLVAEWIEIEQVVPSPNVLVTLAEVPPAATFTVSAEEWTLVAAIAGGCTVHELARYLSVDDLDASRGVKKLVEAGLAVVGADTDVRADHSHDPVALSVDLDAEIAHEREPDEDPTVLVRQLASLTVEDEEAEIALAEPDLDVAHAETPEPSDDAPAAPAKGDAEEPLSRGTLLKFLSSVRT